VQLKRIRSIRMVTYSHLCMCIKRMPGGIRAGRRRQGCSGSPAKPSKETRLVGAILGSGLCLVAPSTLSPPFTATTLSFAPNHRTRVLASNKRVMGDFQFGIVAFATRAAVVAASSTPTLPILLLHRILTLYPSSTAPFVTLCNRPAEDHPH
jgi:hypothetical protein